MPNSGYNRGNKKRKYKVRLPVKYDYRKIEERDFLKDIPNTCLAVQTYVAGEHSVDADQFEDMIAEFFHPYQVPPPLIVGSKEVDDWLVATVATTMDWAYDEDEKETNEDIEYHFSTRIDTHKPKKGSNDIASGRYSDTLFRGLSCVFPDITTFHFYKATCESGYTLAFAAVCDDRSVEYLGNVSDLFP